MTAKRIETLRNYLVEVLSGRLPDDVFMAVNDESTFLWIDVENFEALLVTIAPAKFEVAS